MRADFKASGLYGRAAGMIANTDRQFAVCLPFKNGNKSTVLQFHDERQHGLRICGVKPSQPDNVQPDLPGDPFKFLELKGILDRPKCPITALRLMKAARRSGRWLEVPGTNSTLGTDQSQLLYCEPRAIAFCAFSRNRIVLTAMGLTNPSAGRSPALTGCAHKSP